MPHDAPSVIDVGWLPNRSWCDPGAMRTGRSGRCHSIEATLVSKEHTRSGRLKNFARAFRRTPRYVSPQVGGEKFQPSRAGSAASNCIGSDFGFLGSVRDSVIALSFSLAE